MRARIVITIVVVGGLATGLVGVGGACVVQPHTVEIGGSTGGEPGDDASEDPNNEDEGSTRVSSGSSSTGACTSKSCGSSDGTDPDEETDDSSDDAPEEAGETEQEAGETGQEAGETGQEAGETEQEAETAPMGRGPSTGGADEGSLARVTFFGTYGRVVATAETKTVWAGLLGRGSEHDGDSASRAQTSHPVPIDLQHSLRTDRDVAGRGRRLRWLGAGSGSRDDDDRRGLG